MKLIYSLHSCVICSYHAGNVHSIKHCSGVCLSVLYLFIRLVFAAQCYACAVLAMGLCLCLVCFICTVRVCIV